MKVEKKHEEKFIKTDKGKKLYMMKIISNILYVLSFVLLFIIIVNQGKELTGLLIVLVITSFIFILLATLICTLYYCSLQQYINDNKKKKE